MDDFGTFCYLDVHKTGSTFVSKVLSDVSLKRSFASSKHSAIETLGVRHLIRVARYRDRYARLSGGTYRSDCFYFNSIRNPFEYYASLYNYGCDGRGGLFDSLQRSGWSDLYDRSENGFLEWVRVVLDPENTGLVAKEFHQTCGAAVGILTFRFLWLSVVSPWSRLRGIGTLEEARDVLERDGICKATLRNEALNVELLELFEGPLRADVDLERARSLLGDSERVNASIAATAQGSALEQSSAADLVRERDGIIFERFYPELLG